MDYKTEIHIFLIADITKKLDFEFKILVITNRFLLILNMLLSLIILFFPSLDKGTHGKHNERREK